jgi:hypothetical protein
MLEKDIEKKVCDYARLHNMLAYKFTSPGHIGVPDRMFITLSGKIFFIEFKSAKGLLTTNQMREIARMQGRGLTVYVVNDVDNGKAIIDKHATN